MPIQQRMGLPSGNTGEIKSARKGAGPRYVSYLAGTQLRTKLYELLTLPLHVEVKQGERDCFLVRTEQYKRMFLCKIYTEQFIY